MWQNIILSVNTNVLDLSYFFPRNNLITVRLSTDDIFPLAPMWTKHEYCTAPGKWHPFSNNDANEQFSLSSIIGNKSFTEHPIEWEHSFLVCYFTVYILSSLKDWCVIFMHILQGCFIGSKQLWFQCNNPWIRESGGFPLQRASNEESLSFFHDVIMDCCGEAGTVPITSSYNTLNFIVDTLSLRQNGPHFADSGFKCVILNQIKLLVQIMAWRRPGNKP